MLKVVISLILVGIFLYFTITSIQRLIESGEEVERTKREAEQAQREAVQSQQELEQTVNEYIQAENERNTRIARA